VLRRDPPSGLLMKPERYFLGSCYRYLRMAVKLPTLSRSARYTWKVGRTSVLSETVTTDNSALAEIRFTELRLQRHSR
jgi:hypothetical protein